MENSIQNKQLQKKLARAARSAPGKKQKLTPGRLAYLICAYIFLAFIVIVSIYPIVWVMQSSFKSNAAILTSPFSLPWRLM